MGTSRLVYLISSLCALLAVAIAMNQASLAEEDKGVDKIVPATPKLRNAPNYPVKCSVSSDNVNGDDLATPVAVTLTFNVDSSGKTDDIRIADSNNACFNEGAVNVVRTWLYEPRTVNGRRQTQYDLETTIAFVLQDKSKAQINDFDAQPLKRTPPTYPEHCLRRADRLEYVMLEFDIDESGNPQDPRVIESSSVCFNNAALRSIGRWKYSPRTVDGLPTIRPNVKTRISFQIAPETWAQLGMRNRIVSKVKGISRLIGRKKMDQADERITKMLTDETLNLSVKERALILQMRGAYRIDQKDYAGALDDLRYARQYGHLSADTHKAVGETIVLLEKALGLADGLTPAHIPSSEKAPAERSADNSPSQ